MSSQVVSGICAGLIASVPRVLATQTGSERHPDRRPRREFAMHWTPMLTFGMVIAFGYEWLHRRVATR